MKNETVKKASKARSSKTQPTEGGRPSSKTNADVGALTRGSTGRPKAERGKGAQRSSGKTEHVTRANKTTSTNFPAKAVPKSFLNKLGEMYRSESELSLALPLIVKAAKSKDLKTLLRVHLQETRDHAKSLKKVAKSLGQELPTKSCPSMTRMIKEGVKLVGKRLISSEQDSEIIALGQRIEQFEMDSYQELSATAEEQEYTHERAILTSILHQEKLAHELLGQLAEGKGPIGELIEKASRKRALN